MVLQRQRAEPLAAHAERPVGQAARRAWRRVALPRNVSTTGIFGRIAFGSSLQLAVLDQVRHQRVQAVHRDELFGEIERRPEMIDAAVDVVGIARLQMSFVFVEAAKLVVGVP